MTPKGTPTSDPQRNEKPYASSVTPISEMEDHEIISAVRGGFQQLQIRDVLKEQMEGHESRRKEAKHKRISESRLKKIPDLSKQPLNS